MTNDGSEAQPDEQGSSKPHGEGSSPSRAAPLIAKKQALKLLNEGIRGLSPAATLTVVCYLLDPPTDD